MSPYYQDDRVTVYHGDCLEVLPTLADSSIDAVVTDPPYGLEFMGRAWDRYSPWEFQEWCEGWARECLRALKPGGHLLAFGGTRTWHRLACAIEDARFEVRDSIAWLYGSGFPKSLNVGDGRGTALKPAFEPVVVARKPLCGTVLANVAQHGTGSLNIDACRVDAGQDYYDKCASVVGLDSNRNGAAYGEWKGVREDSASPVGRWPTNAAIDEHTAELLDKDSGITRDGVAVKRNQVVGSEKPNQVYGKFKNHTDKDEGYGGAGGASRFFPTFKYQAKADSSQRPTVNGVAHPTVKPLDLMRWLIRLVTPPGGVVLDPFAGSGTTAEAAIHEHKRAIVIEREPDYLPLIMARLSKPMAVGFDFEEGA